MKEATLLKKSAEVDQVAEQFSEAKSLVFVDYLGLTVEQVTELRKKLYLEGIDLKVIKNNILKRAAAKAGYGQLEEHLKGPSAVAFSKDATAASRIIYNFAKDNKQLTVKTGVVEGKIMSVDELKVISTLPNRDGMLSMLLSVLQAPIRNLGVVIKAVAEQKEV